ncbi:MAG: virulence RhuM family protein [Candidatus Kapabacteria bacterium]|nr:virulence RhuM family protein [Candidatus Kapabacteria bacterium]
MHYDAGIFWQYQRRMAQLFGPDVRTMNEYLPKHVDSVELSDASAILRFRIVRTEGKRQVAREVDNYNLDDIISAGHRVNHCVLSIARGLTTCVQARSKLHVSISD